MGVGFPGQGEVVFLPGQESLALVGEIEAVILLTDADHRFRAEIGLFNLVEGMGVIASGRQGTRNLRSISIWENLLAVIVD